MRSHAKASTAGSNRRRAGGLGRTALLALSAAAFLALFASPASAEIVVNLSGSGSGAVISTPAGIECSNVGGGSPGPDCSQAFPFTGLGNVQLTATPAGDSYFLAWSGTGTLDGNCSSGSVNPCKLTDPGPFGFPPVNITAAFDLLPDPPTAVTGNASPGPDFSLRTLEGTVDPEEFKVGECHFEYGTTTEYGTVTPCVEPDASELDETSTAPEAVHASSEPLEPNTTYHWRLVASNLGGTSEGEDHSFTTGPAPVGECPNEARRLEQGVKSLRLPNCMALEMVSPVQKHGAPAKNPNVSADGSRISFVSQAALGEDPPGLFSVGGATYLASRNENSGWNTEMTVPHVEPRFADQWATESERRPSFTPDFSRWFGIGSTEQQLSQGIARAYEAGLGGFFKPLSAPFAPFSFAGAPKEVIFGTKFQAASTDRSHLYFQPGAQATYFAGDPTLLSEPAVYLARSDAGAELAPELLQRDRNGKAWGGNCSARLGGIGTTIGSAPNGARSQGAVSFDGSHTYLSARASQPQDGSCDPTNKLRILERTETPSGPQIVPLFASECSRPALPDPPGPCSSSDGDDLYQGASLDQSKVYFTTNRQLADTDIDGSSEECSLSVATVGCDLYLYDRTRPAGERLIQVSAGEDAGAHEVGSEADVFNGITAISADGSHVYFVATGVLTGATNPENGSAQEGQPNLYLWDAQSEETSYLGTLDPEDGITNAPLEHGRSLWGGEGTWRNGAYPVPVTEQGGNGHIIVFESKAELSKNDGDGSRLDVYRYDSDSETLECLSCAPDSSPLEPDEEPFDVTAHGEAALPLPAGTDFAERWRWVSEDGEMVAFATEQGLVSGDVNGSQDFYLWKEGHLTRLPGEPFGGSAAAGSAAPPEAVGPFLSHDGSTVAFVTATPLLSQDGDTAADVYVAREKGGYPLPPTPIPCEPGNPGKPCQPTGMQPTTPQTTSEALGSGNPKPHGCTKKKVRRHGRCVAKHKRHAKRGRNDRRINDDRRAGK